MMTTRAIGPVALAAWLGIAGVACGPAEPDAQPDDSTATASDGSTSDGTTTQSDTATATAPDGTADDTMDDSAGDTGPMGPCPLEGMFMTCTVDGVEGVTYCDEVDGEQMWGPCVIDPACEIGENLPGCQDCELVEGVPTVSGSAGCECPGAGGLPECEQTECVQSWDYSCDDCQSFPDGGNCFSYSEGCSNPLQACDLGFDVCPRVWAQAQEEFDVLDTLEDDAAAECVLTSLRDGIPGSFRIIWGTMFDGGWVSSRVHSNGDGTVLVEWFFDCPGCINFGHVGRSGRLELQPASYFDDCLADPTSENLIQCTVGMLEFEPESPPPEGYVPPFTTGTCMSIDTTCP